MPNRIFKILVLTKKLLKFLGYIVINVIDIQMFPSKLQEYYIYYEKFHIFNMHLKYFCFYNHIIKELHATAVSTFYEITFEKLPVESLNCTCI